MQQSYFGHPEFAKFAPGMKTLDDAQSIRRRLYGAFEVAETLETAEEREEWLTFAVTGGGPDRGRARRADPGDGHRDVEAAVPHHRPR